MTKWEISWGQCTLRQIVCCDNNDNDCRERLLATDLDSLELWRLRYDLTLTNKLLSNKLFTDKDGNMMTSSFPALVDIDVNSFFFI